MLFKIYTHKDAYTSLHNCLIIFLGKNPSSGIARIKGCVHINAFHIFAKMPSKMFEQLYIPSYTASLLTCSVP